METSLINRSIEDFGELSWGTHFCQFYRTKQDLIDVLAPFFEAGLKGNEFCLWVTSEPLGVEEAREALSARMPELNDYIAKGQLQIIPHDKVYQTNGRFDQASTMDVMIKKLNQALEMGYAGLRVTGNTFWLETKDWKNFHEYEAAVNDVIGRNRIKALCTYPVGKCSASDVLDVIATHQYSIGQGGGRQKLATEAAVQPKPAYPDREDHTLSLIEAAASVIVCLSPDHRITEFNPEAERLYGKSRREVMGKDYFELFLPDSIKTAVAADMEKVLSGEPTRGLENPVLTPLGERQMQWTIGPLKNAHGRVIGVIKLGQDVSESKKIEESLRRTRDFLEKLIRYANAPIIVWNAQRIITQFNRAFEHLTGLSATEVIGHELSILFPETTRLDSLEKIARTSTGEFWDSVEIPVRCKDGDTRLALWNSANIYNEEGNLTATIAQGLDITERKRAESQLRQTRNYLEKLLNYANAPIIVWDTDSKITQFNHAFERLTGYGMAEAIGCELKILFPDETREESLDLIRRAAAGEFWESVEIPIQRKDGDVRIALWNSANIYAQDGRLQATIAQGQNITERKEAENQLRETRDYLEKLINYANAPIIVWDTDSHITEFNQAFERLTGYAAAEVLGRELSILFPEESRVDSLDKIERAAAGEFWESVEIPILRRDGEIRIALWNSANIYSEDGDLEATIAQGQDITERMQAQEVLKKQAELIDLSPDAILVRGKDGTITFWSRGAEALYGWTKEEALGRITHDLLKTRFPEPLKTINEQLEREKRWSGELIHRTADGSEVTVQSWWLARIGPEGEVTEALETNVDITQRKLAESEVRSYADKLEASNRELEAFNYSVSHDLRAPLRAIDGFSQILQEDYRSKLDDEGCRVLDVIRDNTQKMGTLIDDLLSLSRLGRKQIEPVDIDMEKLAEAVFHELGDIIPERKIDFQLSEIPNARADSALIRQVWINLLSNAMKFTGPRETAMIKVDGGVEDGMAYYCITDNGVGFNMKYADKLFGVFQRLHSEEEFEGTGVGLAIVNRIVQRHGGRVWAEGEIERGAKFCFALPKEGGKNG